MYNVEKFSFRTMLCRVDQSSHFAYIYNLFGAKILRLARIRMTTASIAIMLYVLSQADKHIYRISLMSDFRTSALGP